MSDGTGDDENGKVFDFKELVPRLRKRREERKRGPKAGPLFSRDADDARRTAKLVDASEAGRARERSVWGGKLRKEAVQGAREAAKKVTELSVRSSFVRRMVLRLPLWMTANRVTLFRTLLVAPIMALVACERYGAASLLYAFAMFLDFVDGAIAKNRGHATPEDAVKGAVYDSTADKIVNCAVLGQMYGLGLLPDLAGGALLIITCTIAVGLVFVRLWKIMRSSSRSPRVEAVDAGKFKLVLETVAILLMLLAVRAGSVPLMDFGLLALLFACMFAVWSFIAQCRR